MKRRYILHIPSHLSKESLSSLSQNIVLLRLVKPVDTLLLGVFPPLLSTTTTTSSQTSWASDCMESTPIRSSTLIFDTMLNSLSFQATIAFHFHLSLLCWAFDGRGTRNGGTAAVTKVGVNTHFQPQISNSSMKMNTSYTCTCRRR